MTQRGKFRKQEAAIAALLSSPTIADAAAKVGICERTLLRWLQDENFANLYRQAQGRLLEAAVNSLRQAALTFASTLRTVAEDVNAPPASRATAAARALELLLKAASLESLTQRVDDLERNAATIGRR